MRIKLDHSQGIDNKSKNKEGHQLLKNHIVFCSGGKASFAVADFVKKKYPEDNILLYFTDTLWENHDTYRFISESSDKLKLPLLIHCAGITPMQLMFEKKLVFNNMIGDCSKILKMRVASDFLKKQIIPKIEKWKNHQILKQEDFITDATLYFGIGIEELHREEAIVRNWRPFHVEMPLINNFIPINNILKEHNIIQPELYKLGFSHNNCNGRCVKAGQGHYRNLKKTMPDIFQKHMEEEYHLYMCVSAYRYILDNKVPEEDQIPAHMQESMLQELDDAYRDYFYGKCAKPKLYIHPAASASTRYMKIKKYSFMKRKGKNPEVKQLEDDEGNLYTDVRYPSEPFTLREFNLIENSKPEQIDLFDIGGCGCFVQF
ncbi:phosphoadenosine phosphosulfate reductase family protein [Paenibacillus terrae]|uniref:Phosphoadenosine phosphosulphate reductase domain-containing protein n=1 Tax=Paenibacillus terrae TaxID=159743 RepID=A0A0D7WXR0_9BACL|nr:phosphoadenosine phosphosulfate reductase family protein [Paenibacillus terrae]KJD43981.1 hypothetical protein QD47_19420 [Paenibacillus terrae]